MATLHLTNEIEDAIVAAVRRGVPRAQAFRLAGVDAARLFQWQQIAGGSSTWQGTSYPVTERTIGQIRVLFGRIVDAEAALHAEMIEVISKAANTTNAKTGIPEWRAADVLLSKHPVTRKDWYEHREVSVEQTVDITVRTAQRQAMAMSDSDLLAAREAPLVIEGEVVGDAREALPVGEDTRPSPGS